MENGDNLIINSTKAKKIPPEKIIDEVVLRDNPSYSNQIDSNIYELSKYSTKKYIENGTQEVLDWILKGISP